MSLFLSLCVALLPYMSLKSVLAHSALQTKTDNFANSIDPCHQNLHYRPSCFLSFFFFFFFLLLLLLLFCFFVVFLFFCFFCFVVVVVVLLLFVPGHV